MKKIILTLAVVAVAAASCQKDFVYNDNVKEKESVEITATRSYDEALKIAEDALSLIDGVETRSGKKRVIKRAEGQTVLRPVTRGSETAEEPIMYVFNNENDEGFTVVAANRSQQPLIAVTEQGNYTYGEPTGVEPFDLLMEDVATTLSFNPPFIPTPDIPLIPKPGLYVDTVDKFVRVNPLLTTKWGQHGIYNALCYNQQSQKCPAGCVATALAQILAFHKHPSQIQVTFDGDYYGDTIYLDWTKILKHTHNNCVHTECASVHNNISILFREIGERVDMDYDPEEGSGTTDAEALDFLRAIGFTSAKLTDGMSYALTKIQLQDGNPVYMSGSRYDAETNKYIGHAWVADGVHDREYGTKTYVSNPNYDPSIIYNNPEPEYILAEWDIVTERMLHFNWGFDGDCNGWFATDNICMKDGVEYDSYYSYYDFYDRDYKYSMSVIYDISIW